MHSWRFFRPHSYIYNLCISCFCYTSVLISPLLRQINTSLSSLSLRALSLRVQLPSLDIDSPLHSFEYAIDSSSIHRINHAQTGWFNNPPLGEAAGAAVNIVAAVAIGRGDITSRYMFGWAAYSALSGSVGWPMQQLYRSVSVGHL